MKDDTPPAEPRPDSIPYPLGLPQGSVRAMLALSIFAMVMGMVLLGREVPRDLWLVILVILGYYYASRQAQSSASRQPRSPDRAPFEPHPLRLPRGSVRWLLLLMFAGTATFLVLRWRSDGGLPEQFLDNGLYPMIALGAFFAGRIVRVVLSPFGRRGRLISGLNNIKALLALASAGVLIVLTLTGWSFEGSLLAEEVSMSFTIFYFGSR